MNQSQVPCCSGQTASCRLGWQELTEPRCSAQKSEVLTPHVSTEQPWKRRNSVFLSAVCISKGQNCLNQCSRFLSCACTRIKSETSVDENEKKNAPLTVQLVREQTPRDTGISACTYGAGIFDTAPTFLKGKSQLCFRNCPSLGALFVFFFAQHIAYGIHAAASSNPRCAKEVPCSATLLQFVV